MVAFADQLNANFGGIRTLEDWGKKTLRTRVPPVRLAEPELIPFTRYTQACREAGITVESSWALLLDAWMRSTTPAREHHSSPSGGSFD